MNDIRLADLTTMRVGGPAKRLITAETRDALVDAALDTWADDEPWFVLGGGSNVVVGDAGFDGTVLHVATRGITELPEPRRSASPAPAWNEAERQRSAVRAQRPVVARRPVHLRVEAGEPWDDLVAYTVQRGWAGIEALSGVPGSTGAAPVQNIGAYGQELAASITAVEFLDAETGAISVLSASQLELGYRTSVLKRGRRGVVLALHLVLAADDGARVPLSAPIAYAQLAEALGVPVGSRVPITVLRDTVLALRRSKGMVRDDADPESVSVGSFFTNPVVSESFARTLPADAPRWPTAADEPDLVVPLGQHVPHRVLRTVGPRVKLSAAWLIEHAGIGRGFRLPGSRVHVSAKHTLAIVNGGGATASQVFELARYIQNLVQIEFGVVLQPEPLLLSAEL